MQLGTADQSAIAAAREAFLASGETSPHVRPEILRAWRRSLAAGASSQGRPPVIDSTFNPDSALCRAVAPVAETLIAQLGPAGFAIMMIDAQGRLAGRWVSDSALSALLDEMGSVIGAQFDESVVGSTGLGTVLENRETAVVDGAEHFNRRFDPVIAVGSPIINPASGRVEGVLDLVCATGFRPEMMAAVVEQAVRDVGERLVSGYAAEDRLMLDAFLRLDRRGNRRPVLAINRRLLVSNACGDVLLRSHTHDTLWRMVATALEAGESSLLIADNTGSAIEVEVRAVDDADAGHGALLQASSARLQHRVEAANSTEPIVAAVLGRLPGRSVWWRSTVGSAARAVVDGRRLLLWGPPGSGKTVLAAALIEATAQRRSTDVPAVFDDIELSCLPALNTLGDKVAQAPVTPVIATVTASCYDDLPPRLLAEFDHVVEVPALDCRPEDIDDIAVRLLDQRSATPASLTVDALRELRSRSWPGNAYQLGRVLDAAVSRGAGCRILRADHLPPDPQGARAVTRLSYLEIVERRALAELLVRMGGNKRQVAEFLGLSRSTLYRKLAALQLD